MAASWGVCVCVCWQVVARSLCLKWKYGADEGVTEEGRHAQEGKPSRRCLVSARCVCVCVDVYVRLVMCMYVCVCFIYIERIVMRDTLKLLFSSPLHPSSSCFSSSPIACFARQTHKCSSTSRQPHHIYTHPQTHTDTGTGFGSVT